MLSCALLPIEIFLIHQGPRQRKLPWSSLTFSLPHLISHNISYLWQHFCPELRPLSSVLLPPIHTPPRGQSNFSKMQTNPVQILHTRTHTHTQASVCLPRVLFFRGGRITDWQGGWRECTAPDRPIKVLILLPINQIAFVLHHHFQKYLHTNPPRIPSLYLCHSCAQNFNSPLAFHLLLSVYSVPVLHCFPTCLLLRYAMPIQHFPLRLSSETVLGFPSIWNVLVSVTPGVCELPLLRTPISLCLHPFHDTYSILLCTLVLW